MNASTLNVEAELSKTPRKQNGSVHPAWADIEIGPDHVVRNKQPPADVPKVPMAEVLSQHMIDAEKHGAVGMIDFMNDCAKISYAQFYRESKRFACALIDHGLTLSDLVLLFGKNSAQYAYAMLGVIWTGITFSPVTPANGPFEMCQQIKDSQGTVLVIDYEKLHVLKQALSNQDFKPMIKPIKLFVVINCPNEHDPLFEDICKSVTGDTVSCLTYESIVSKCNDERISKLTIPHYPVDHKHYFMIIYTSGTTGLPKGAVHSNRTMLYALWITTSPDKKYGQQFLTWYPFGHISGSVILMSNIYNGGTTVLMNDVELSVILEYASKNRLVMLGLSPEHVVQMAENDYKNQYDLSSLKVIFSGGAKISEKYVQMVREKYKVFFLEGYAATEFLGSVRSMEWMFGMMSKPGNVGRPLPGVEMKIVDLETGKNLPAYQRGEICFKGEQRFVEYLRNEQATKNTIDQQGFYHSGDVGYFDETGALFITDRIKELIKFRCWSIAPSEIEQLIETHPAVESVCVVGVKHEQDGSWPRAFIKVKEGQQVSQDDLIQFVQDNLGFQRRLRAGVRFVDSIPRTSIGKVDRKYFRNLVKDELITDIAE